MPLAGFLMNMLGITEDGEQQQQQHTGPPPGYKGTAVPSYLFDAKILDEIDFGGVRFYRRFRQYMNKHPSVYPLRMNARSIQR